MVFAMAEPSVGLSVRLSHVHCARVYVPNLTSNFLRARRPAVRGWTPGESKVSVPRLQCLARTAADVVVDASLRPPIGVTLGMCFAVFVLVACSCSPPPAVADERPPSDIEPLVIEFECLGGRQEISTPEESEFRVVTDTEKGKLCASGRVGRVCDGQVDLVLQIDWEPRVGSRKSVPLSARLVLGQFTVGGHGIASRPVVSCLWVRRGVDPVPSLTQALRRRDGRPWVAARQLGRLRAAARAAVPDLVNVLSLTRSECPKLKGFEVSRLREAAAVTLGEIGAAAKDAVPALVQQLDDERSGDVRVAAAAALWKITKHPDAVPSLLTALGDSERIVRVKALDALREIGLEAPAVGPALLPMLEESDLGLRAGAAAALWATTRDTRAVDTLVAMLESDSPGRGHARKPLRSVGFPGGQPATEAVARDAFSPNSITRWSVGNTLIEIDPDASRTVPLLLQSLRENDGRGCGEAGDVLARFGSTVVPQLRDLFGSEDEHARDLAFSALWIIGTPAVETLAEALRHRNPEVRRRAAACLRTPEANIAPAVPNLVRALGDDDEKVRVEASRTLSEVGSPAIPAVEQLLKDPDPGIRELAQRILSDIEAWERMERRDD